MIFKSKDGTVFNYNAPPEHKESPVTEEKLKRFENLLADLRIKWKENPSKRWVIEYQARMIQHGIDIIKRKLSFKQRKLI